MDDTPPLPEPARVRRLQQILLWPLRLMPVGEIQPGVRRRPWDTLAALPDSPWRELVDEYTGGAENFHERHYQEFVTFLPYVQRFLYGEGRSRLHDQDAASAEAATKVYRRRDVRRLRARVRPGDAPLLLEVVHVDLYFFFDVDVVLLNVEFAGSDLSLPQAQELLYRLGRAYPGGWDADGQPLHSLAEAEWLGADDAVLARADSLERERFIAHVHEHRAPRIASHWAWLLQPMVCHDSAEPGELRYRQIENYRMPVMGYLAVDEPQRLMRGDFVRLGLVTGACGEGEAELPYAESHLQQFEHKHCYDRFWAPAGAAPHTRYLCSGQALVVVGRADSSFYCCRDRGVLAQFRHPHFLVFLIAQFQKAALLMFSDRMAEALRRLVITDPSSVRQFKRTIRFCFEDFLRFSHRYWFHEVAEQAASRALFRMTTQHLELEPLYAEVKTRIADMSDYLDADSLRRQANTVVRLTVVTIFGLIGTITTGFLGMNLLAEADAPLPQRVIVFALTLVATIVLTVYTMTKSKRLSDFLDALSEERLSWKQKLGVFLSVWRPGTSTD